LLDSILEQSNIYIVLQYICTGYITVDAVVLPLWGFVYCRLFIWHYLIRVLFRTCWLQRCLM